MICNNGYRYVGNNCLLLPPNCLNLSPNGNCQVCNNGFGLVGINCVPMPQNCQKMGPNGGCQICNNGYGLLGVNCLILPQNCQTLNQNGGCATCFNGFSVVNGICSNTPAPSLPNCLSSQSGICIVCIDRYFPLNGLCTLVSPSCNNYNPQNGNCIDCKAGYILQGVNCVLSVQPVVTGQVNTDPNCLQYVSGMCRMCSQRYYVSPSNGVCVPVNPLCNNYNQAGECTSCYSGYTVSGGQCIITLARDPNCRTPVGNGCQACYAGYFYSSSAGLCKLLNPLCKTSNSSTGACTSCYPGYNLDNNSGNCVVFFRDPNCKTFNGNDCIKCSERFYINAGKCLPVNPLCQGYSEINGQCTSCYPGYSVDGGKCIVGGSIEPNCQTFSGNFCVACFSGYYPSEGKCKQVNPLCKTFDSSTGFCTSCYPGYSIIQGLCEISLTKDANCKQFDSANPNYCLACYSGYISTQGKCKEQNLLCKKINLNNGNCTECWPGYTLYNGDCVVIGSSQSISEVSGDIYCIEVQGTVCVKCSSGYYLNKQQAKCKQINPLCRSSNPDTGACTDCYQGYSISQGNCVIVVVVQIPNCLTTNNGVCLECIEGYFVKNNACSAVSITCATYDKSNGKCKSCISGHFFQNDECIYPALFDPNCVYYESSYCSRCRVGYYLDYYICSQVSSQCTNFDYQTSTCKACIQNLVPQGAGCV